jgi:hypothetical protein
LRIAEIELEINPFGDQITLCIVQLKSPFYDEINKFQSKENLSLGWYPEAIAERKIKLMNILDELANLKRKLDLVIFPEYSIPELLLTDINKLSNQSKLGIICNSYHSDVRESITSIFLPTLDTIKCSKITRFTPENDFLRSINDDDKVLYRILWNQNHDQVNRKTFLQVLNCRDFIEHWSDAIDFSLPGIVAVPMSSSDIDPFLASADSVIRKTTNSSQLPHSIIVALCNSTDMIYHKGPASSIGGSRVIGPYNSSNDQNNLIKGVEGTIIITFNPYISITRPTPITGENVVLENKVIFSINNRGIFSGEEDMMVYNRKYILHPDVYKIYLHLNNYYLFFRVYDYFNYREKLQQVDMGSHSICGYHDLLIQSYEESDAIVRMRLQSLIGENYKGNFKFIETLIVEKTYKHRGFKFYKYNEQNMTFESMVDPREIPVEMIDKNRIFIRDLLLGKETNQKKIKILRDNNIIFETYAKSDVSDDEKEKQMSEYFVLVFLISKVPGIEPLEIFEQRVLSKLINNDKVKTIDLVRGVQFQVTDLTNAHFVLHVVGFLNDVTNIVLYGIQQQLVNSGITFGTRIIPNAETLSTDKFPAFAETNISPWQREIVEKMILTYAEEGRPDPFTIKKLDKDMLGIICRIIKRYGKIARAKSIRDDIPIDDLHRLLSNYVYGISLTFKKGINHAMIHLYCQDFYMNVAQELEGYLKEIIMSKHNNLEILNGKLTELITKKGKGYGKPIKINTEALGTLKLLIIYWNSEEKDKIIGDDFTAVLRTKLFDQFINMRDYFSHAPSDGEKLHIKKIDDINTLINATETALEVIAKYKYDIPTEL